MPAAPETPPERDLHADDGAISIEEIEDAVVDGDSPLPTRTGTARAALRHRTFRIVFLGAFASNIGTWMQNVVLGAYAYDLTHSSTFVGVIIFAQLGPTLVLPMVGGLLADKVDRKRFLILLSIEQLVFSLGVALVVASPHPSKALLVDHGPGGRRRERHVRARLLGDPARAGRERGSAGRDLAQLGPDERVAGHRPDHRRRALFRHRSGLDLRGQRGDLPLRGGCVDDGDPAGRPPDGEARQPLAAN